MNKNSKLELLNGSIEFTKLRKKFFSSRESAGEFLGVSTGAVSKWEMAERGIPAYAWNQLNRLNQTKPVKRNISKK